MTYSPAATLVPTYECFNRCTYCNFRQEPGESPWLTVTVAAERLARLKGVIEILLLSGEVHPRSDRRRAWVDRLEALAQLVLDRGFLPHTNAGPLTFEEMQRLGQVNVSMGLMLEQLNPALQNTVHRYAPSKQPERRLQQLIWAGQLRIPFTTGLLLGIGETETDWRQTLQAIADVQRRWGHIQEVILQPYRQGSHQLSAAKPFDLWQMPRVVAIARDILPPEIVLQVPPNLLSDSDLLTACIASGVTDLGGIGPKDEVNPDYHQPDLVKLQANLARHGWRMVPRLPVYPQYDDWLPQPLQRAVQVWRDRLKTHPPRQAGLPATH